jgi:hypothetical protein
MFTRHLTRIVCGAALLGLVVASPDGAAATAPRQTTYLTFSGPVSLPGVTLPGGTYTFELIPLRPDMVRVLSRDRSQVYFTGFTRQVPRPAGLTADRPVTFGETPRGMAPRIQTWYPPDLLTGNAFIYPTAPR